MSNDFDSENGFHIPTNLGVDTLDMLDSWRDVGQKALVFGS